MASLMSILKQAGFRGSALTMAYAIAMAESGGNARAHNPNASTGDNSYGLFQINMLGAMGPERRRRYGLKSNNDLFDPLLNAKIAFKMSNGGKNWTPWSTYLRGDYKKFYGQSGATVKNGGSSSGGGGGGGGTVAQLDDRTLAQTYGLTLDLINSDKSLKKLFKKAVAGGWSGTLFQAHLKETSWWKKQSASLRKYITQKYTDPASWKASREAAGAALRTMAVAVGLTDADLVKGGKWTSLLNDLVYKKLALGWTDARLKSYIGSKTSSHGGVMYGDAGEAFDKLHEAAYLNGVTYSAASFESRARSIVSGKSTLEAQTAEIRKQAAAKYSAFSTQILAGMNAMDLAQAYIKSVGTLLELPETDIDLNNKWVNKAMTSGKPNEPYSIWQFENDVRSDPLWNKTNNARESMFGTARQVLKDFGLAY